MKKILLTSLLSSVIVLAVIFTIAFINYKKEQARSAAFWGANSKVVEPTYSNKPLLPSEVFGQHKKSVTQTNKIEK